MNRLVQKLFFEHPKAVGETYLQHFKSATSIGNKMMFFGVAEYVHAIVPGIDLFKAVGTSSSKEIEDLANTLNKRQTSE